MLEIKNKKEPENLINILWIDDDPDFLDISSKVIERKNENIKIITETSPKKGLEKLKTKEKNIDCIVSDYKMPVMNGIELLKKVREKHENLPFILLTGKGSEKIASKAISKGVTDYLQKETASDQYKILTNRIENAVNSYRSNKKLKEKTRELETLIDNLPGIVYKCKNERG